MEQPLTVRQQYLTTLVVRVGMIASLFVFLGVVLILQNMEAIPRTTWDRWITTLL